MARLIEIPRPSTRVHSSKWCVSVDSARGPEKSSLNKDFRKRELIRIAQENQALFKRLQDRRPNYHTKRFYAEYQSSVQFLKNICEYPLVLKKNGRCQSVDIRLIA